VNASEELLCRAKAAQCLQGRDFFCLFAARSTSPLFEITRVLVRLDHMASIIVNANDGQMMDCDALCSRLRRESFRPRHCDRSYHFVVAVWRAKEARIQSREVLGNNLPTRYPLRSRKRYSSKSRMFCSSTSSVIQSFRLTSSTQQLKN
jgi:hypothetical protein